MRFIIRGFMMVPIGTMRLPLFTDLLRAMSQEELTLHLQLPLLVLRLVSRIKKVIWTLMTASPITPGKYLNQLFIIRPLISAC